jgi:hypothetical protein
MLGVVLAKTMSATSKKVSGGECCRTIRIMRTDRLGESIVFADVTLRLVAMADQPSDPPKERLQSAGQEWIS